MNRRSPKENPVSSAVLSIRNETNTSYIVVGTLYIVLLLIQICNREPSSAHIARDINYHALSWFY